MNGAITTKSGARGSSAGMKGLVRRSLARIGGMLLESYRLGGRALLVAPALVAIAVLPEAAQHVAEIKLNMFVSTEAFRALANDPTRWAFGYAKIAGFLMAILAIARFWSVGTVRATLLVPPSDLLRLIFAIGLTFVAALPFDWARKQGLPVTLDWSLAAVSSVIQAGLLVYIAGALFGDRAMTLSRAFSQSLPTALMITLALAAVFVPSQALHMANHKVAIGSSDAVVWAAMLFDSLWVGLFAALLGSALFAGYASGLTWRGWARRGHAGV